MTLFAGRYTLQQQLAKGGMAEVFLARQHGIVGEHGIDGFGKQVVLKRILPHHSDNPEFVRMFLDEARTAADLSHPNVVSLFDAGKADGTWFITMEYLRGKDLGAVFARSVSRHESLPIPVLTHVLIDAARGLHAAHTKTDLDGRALHIVHRDISPQNLFATWDGITKVLDFGIASAANRSASTEVGVIKGKIAYLAPEQLEGEELDARGDQFALGIVAWELFTNSRLFHRPSDAEVLRAVLEHRVPPPSSVAPLLPKALEEVVLRMLAEHRDDRFRDCAAVADALEAWLDETRTPHSAARVASALRQLFGATEVDPASPLERTQPEFVLPPVPDAATRPERLRPRLPQAEAFMSEVSKFLRERAGPRKSNLVPPMTAFLGREQEVSAVEASLADGAHCVTLVGAGGVGKTRLAFELAWRARERFAGGAWFCDLSEARSLDDVCKAVARALEVDLPLDGGIEHALDRTGRALTELGEALVVLDNFEQLVALAPRTVGRWLQAAPTLRVLVTSRQALLLAGETVQPVAPFPLEGGAQSIAVRLLIERAKQAGRHVEPAEMPVIADICARLEGHALAIELAAPHLATFTAEALLERLRERFGVLGGPDPTKGRHGTLWNAIDWSWQLLEPHERLALAQLSTCRGGFTPESGVEVIDLSPWPDAPPRVEAVIALHRKSLLAPFVAPESPAEFRLKMLDAVWEFSAYQLDALQGVEASRGRHAAHYLALGATCVEQLSTGASERAMGRLFAERENLGEVFERALSTLPPTQLSASNALRAMHALEPVMVRKGPYASHLALLDESLRVAQAVGVEAGTLAMGLRQRGNAWRVRGRSANAVSDLSQALQLAETTGNSGLVARVACDLAVAHFVRGELDEATRGLERANQLAREAKDEAALIETLAYLAIVRNSRRELSAAIAHCDEALPIARARGDHLNEARLLGTMGNIFQEQERLDLAGAFLRDAVRRCQAIREVRLQGYYLGKLAHILFQRGDRRGARARLTEALGLLSDVGDLRHEGLFLTYLATLEAAEGHFEPARNTLGAARVRLESVNDLMLLEALRLRAVDVEVRAGQGPQTFEEPRGEVNEELRLAGRVLARTRQG